MTFDEARDAMLGVFKAAWDATGFKVTYTDVPAQVPADNKVWARVVVRHALGDQASLTGGLGTTMYDRKGTLWIQVFAPPGDGSVAGYAASQLLVNAYQAAKFPVLWFRKVRMTEAGRDGGFERFDVKSDFEYHDVR